MSGSLHRHHQRQEEDIMGQFRVTVPDVGELDQLRTRGGVYRWGLYTLGNQNNPPPERTQSLPGSSCESSMEPMDTDDTRCASEEIYRRISREARLNRFGSVRDVPTQSEPLGILTQGDIVPCERTTQQTQQGHSDNRNQHTESEWSRNGSRKLKRWPKVTRPLTTQTIQEEARAALTEERAIQLRGTDFYLPLVGQPRISERRSWRVLHWSHLNGFSPLCVLRCTTKSLFCANALLHWSQWNGFSPLCVLRCESKYIWV